MDIQEVKILSEQSILIYFGDTINVTTHEKIQAAMSILRERHIEGIVEIIAGYTNICIHFNPFLIQATVYKCAGNHIVEKVISYITKILATASIGERKPSRLIEIPVQYGGEAGPDLAEVAAYHQLTPQQVIDIHTSKEYIVYMLGFAPGFPFLGGLDERIATPRKATPRLKIDAGAVGIAGAQTGVYPLATPGGWQIIGRTTMDLFLPHQTPPTLLQAGDRIRFVAVKEESR